MRAASPTLARVLRALALALGLAAPAFAQTPIALTFSYAGNVQFTGTAGTLRAQPNSVNACALNASGSGTLTIPAGASVVAAHLYWAGSGPTVDAQVTFAGPFGSANLVADRTFTESFVNGATTFQFFSGYEDVTAQVSSSGSYTLSNLSVTNTGSYCSSQAVVSGWSLIVVYSRASEPLRVVNISDGFQDFRGSQLVILDDNFQVPSSGTIDAFVSHVTWEGDVENSTALGGFTENLRFQGTALTDALNPLNNQFNSASNIVGSATTYGVDFDRYNVSSLVTAGQTSATTTYSSGGDLVLLSAEVFSVTNTPTADVSIAKSHVGNFTTGQNGDYTLAVANAGPSASTIAAHTPPQPVAPKPLRQPRQAFPAAGRPRPQMALCRPDHPLRSRPPPQHHAPRCRPRAGRCALNHRASTHWASPNLCAACVATWHG